MRGSEGHKRREASVTSLPATTAVAAIARPPGVGTPRSVRLSLFAAGLAFGAIAHVDATARGAATADWSLIVLAAYSWAYLLAGAIAWERRPDSRVAALMTAVGVVAPAGHFAGSSLAVLYLSPWIGVPLMNVFLVWLILSYPKTVTLIAYVALNVVLGPVVEEL